MLHFERILRKYFNPQLDNEIRQCANEMEDNYSTYQSVLTLSDEDINPMYTLVKIAIEKNEISLPTLNHTHFNVARKLFHQTATVIYQGKFGTKVLKHRPLTKIRNILQTVEIEEAEVIPEDRLFLSAGHSIGSWECESKENPHTHCVINNRDEDCMYCNQPDERK